MEVVSNKSDSFKWHLSYICGLSENGNTFTMGLSSVTFLPTVSSYLMWVIYGPGHLWSLHVLLTSAHHSHGLHQFFGGTHILWRVWVHPPHALVQELQSWSVIQYQSCKLASASNSTFFPSKCGHHGQFLLVLLLDCVWLFCCSGVGVLTNQLALCVLITSFFIAVINLSFSFRAWVQTIQVYLHAYEVCILKHSHSLKDQISVNHQENQGSSIIGLMYSHFSES